MSPFVRRRATFSQPPRFGSNSRRPGATTMMTAKTNEGTIGRGKFLSSAVAGGAAILLGAVVVSVPPVFAVVRGNPPPPGYNKRSGAKSELEKALL